jgi:hypothetical protein
VDHGSFLLDAKIMMLTPWKVLQCADITPVNAEIVERLDKVRRPQGRAAA